MRPDLMLTSGSDAGTDLLADLNRLLREGLAAVDWSEDDAVPRFQITARGRSYVEETNDDDQPSRSGWTDPVNSVTTQRRPR